MRTLISSPDDMTLGQATSLLWYAGLGGDWLMLPVAELGQALALERAAQIVVKLVDDARRRRGAEQ